jgi:circadian clock protein KaiC
VSVLSDCIVLLRYAESQAELKRVLSVLKMRGSGHDRSLRAYTIDDHGLHVGEPLSDLTGIMAGFEHMGREQQSGRASP